MPIAAVVAGWGMKVPVERFSNEAIVRRILDTGGAKDTSAEWIKTRTHIENRHIANSALGETTTFLAAGAAKEALACAGLHIDDIDGIAVATVTADRRGVPSVASAVHELLGGTRKISAYDLDAGCSGFLHALKMERYSILDDSENVLVIGVDRLSTIVNWKDRNTAPLFGDGAGAIILQRRTVSEGTRTGILRVLTSGKGSVAPLNVSLEDGYIDMDGREVFRFATTEGVAMLERMIDVQNLRPSEIDWIFPHQANGRINYLLGEMLRKRLVSRFGEIPEGKMQVFQNIERYGNTSAASIPISLAEAAREGKLKPGQRILAVAYGAGLTSAVADIAWAA